jgi:hypothetical protein
VPQEKSMGFFESVRALVERLRGIDRLTVDLRVQSEPTEARFEIMALGGLRPAVTATDSVLTNFYRGLYSYAVAKNGFKTVRGEVNLVDQRGTNLTCRLFREDEEGGPLACRLEED